MEMRMNTMEGRMDGQQEDMREQRAAEGTHGGGEKQHRHGHCHGRQGRAQQCGHGQEHAQGHGGGCSGHSHANSGGGQAREARHGHGRSHGRGHGRGRGQGQQGAAAV